ncbi:patatin-like phospholipase family protein [Solimonas soli]|uniref:patatin-like phospholipase family protein n=1 Tax=Solimonas soli TaxID=413479 RepID=UPI0004B680D3|nr:patatin-like phospholipase family protein [Solimonas soli]
MDSVASGSSMTGLVLTAGGARGAYQAGVIKRVSEIAALRDGPSPFQIIAGASAGAINGAALAAANSSFAEGAAQLARLWSQLTFSDVFRTDTRALAKTGGKLALDMALGGLIGGGRADALVDSTPLRGFLDRHLRFDGIAEAIAKGDLYALAITATGYHSGKAFTFIQGQAGHPVWNKSRRVALSTQLTLDHVRASSSIPIVFPPVALRAGAAVAYFGDGALRLTTPLSPAIRLGAERLFAIGVRCQEAADSLLRSELAADPDLVASLQRPPLAQICGVFLNAIFLDHLDADVDHLRRMNELVSAFQSVSHTHDAMQSGVSEPMRIVEPLILSPSADLAIIAKTLAHRLPRAIRYVMDGLGTPDAQSADLTSYLLFDKAFTSELIQLGYRDAAQRIDEIEHFLVGARLSRRRA